ncbi:MAG TPA: DUF3352 domain-containing protein [Ktedonobacterales bacterium]|nr:DUF3352 domain-containing protein [Ktedonobacterales bacterium]
MDNGQQSSAPGQCAGCGHILDAQAVYCPTCGRPNPALAGATSVASPVSASDATYATAPVQAADATLPPPLPAWYDQPTATSGMAALATGTALAPEKPIHSHKRRNILTAISAVVVVGLVLSGAYWAYAALASRTDNQLARYFPSSTVAFASADLAAAANNNFNINPADLIGAQASALQKATGLDWQKDVVPWAGPDVAVGVFPLANSQQAVANATTPVGVVALIQSRDDNAAKAAIGKLNAHERQQGTTLQQSSYNGFTFYATGSGSSSGLYGSGSGWVLIASNAEAAHSVIDRINGSSDSLNDQQAFKDAISNLPSNHFGTYYVNLRQALDSLIPVKAPNGLASVSVPFIESYPVAGGYLAWSETGQRSQITFNAVRNPNIPNVSGDTTSFAKLVPSDAVAYAGAGNLGKLVQAFVSQVGVASTGADPLQSALGISASNPLAQQPVGMAALKTSGNAQPVIYIHVSDDAAATQLIGKIAATHNWTATPTTVAGLSATTLSDVSTDAGQPTADGTPVTATVHVVAVAFTVNNTLVIAPDTNSATLVAQVAQGTVSNLTSNATFQKMLKAAPSGAAVTGYVSAAGLQSLMHTPDSTTSGLFAHLDALTATLVWNNSMLQGTLDTGLHS